MKTLAIELRKEKRTGVIYVLPAVGILGAAYAFVNFLVRKDTLLHLPLDPMGVAGFLSGMALANSGLTLLLAHPFVVILKPAVAMSAQPDPTVTFVALAQTLLFLAVGLWMAKYKRYE